MTEKSNREPRRKDLAATPEYGKVRELDVFLISRGYIREKSLGPDEAGRYLVVYANDVVRVEIEKEAGLAGVWLLSVNPIQDPFGQIMPMWVHELEGRPDAPIELETRRDFLREMDDLFRLVGAIESSLRRPGAISMLDRMYQQYASWSERTQGGRPPRKPLSG